LFLAGRFLLLYLLGHPFQNQVGFIILRNRRFTQGIY
jgi:hypothetical protein